MLYRFIKKLILFILPLILVSSIPLSIGIYFGDLLPTSRIIALQEEHDGLYHPAVTREHFIDYRLAMMLHRRADFLVLGSSRFHTVTSAFVTNPDTSFYNGTVPGITLLEVLAMLEVLEEKDAMPEVLLLNLDLIDFNGDRVEFRRTIADISAPSLGSELDRLYNAFQDLSLALVSKPQRVYESMSSARQESGEYIIGRKAIETGQRYRVDGSLDRFYPNNILRVGLREHRQDWNNRDKMYEIGTNLDEESLNALSRMIEIAQAHHTLIIVVLPPYHPEFYGLLHESPEYSYFDAARQAVAELFEGSGMLFYDFTDPNQPYIDPNLFFDGWHLGEVGALSLYVQIVEAQPDLLAQYSELSQLNQLLDNAISFWELEAKS